MDMLGRCSLASWCSLIMLAGPMCVHAVCLLHFCHCALYIEIPFVVTLSDHAQAETAIVALSWVTHGECIIISLGWKAACQPRRKLCFPYVPRFSPRVQSAVLRGDCDIMVDCIFKASAFYFLRSVRQKLQQSKPQWAGLNWKYQFTVLVH